MRRRFYDDILAADTLDFGVSVESFNMRAIPVFEVKTYPNGLFGKPEMAGTYFWHEHPRGEARYGKVRKDYNVLEPQSPTTMEKA